MHDARVLRPNFVAQNESPQIGLRKTPDHLQLLLL